MCSSVTPRSTPTAPAPTMTIRMAGDDTPGSNVGVDLGQPVELEAGRLERARRASDGNVAVARADAGQAEADAERVQAGCAVAGERGQAADLAQRRAADHQAVQRAGEHVAGEMRKA